jgi:hypothetical protein
MTTQSQFGRIELFDDFCGPEIPVANAVAYGVTAGGCSYYIGPYKVTGDLGENDTGIIGVDGVINGVIRVGNNNENGKGVAIGTGIHFSPVLNGMLVAETRVQRPVVTAGNVFFGFCDVNADDVAEPITATGTTLTLTASDICGFLLDSQLTATADWHMPYNGGTTTGATDSTAVVSDVTAVGGGAGASKWDILRIEIASDGTAFWYINGVLKQTVANAVSTTVLLGAYVGCWGTASTLASVDVDYLAVSGNRDWTVLLPA